MPRDFSVLSDRHKRRILRKDVAKSRRTAILNDNIGNFAEHRSIDNTDQIVQSTIPDVGPLDQSSDADIDMFIPSVPPLSPSFTEDENDGSTNNVLLSSPNSSGSFQFSHCSLNCSLCDDLRECFQNHHFSQKAIGDLLSILKKHGHHDLPQDARTFMKTPSNCNEKIIEMSGGKYIHFSLVENLHKIIKNHIISETEIHINLKLNINVDGLPIAKSSGSQFWPILGDVVIDNITTDPFLIGLFHSNKKPENPNEFLKFFVDEYKSIEKNGLIIEDKVYSIKLACIICDAPAKAFIANIKNHTGYHGCTKCICEGDYLERRVVFLSTDCTLRTNESFRNRTDTEHHRGPTILEELNIDMIKQLPIDYMHLVLLGVTKRVLLLWTKGNKAVRLKKNQIENLNEMYLLTSQYVPSNFQRRPRSIADIDRWKASEFRLFLLYIGPVILKNILDDKRYNHFLSLVIGIRLLSERNQSIENIDYANQLLLYYVKKFGIFFGNEYYTYNIHNLIHLPEDVRVHGALDSFSAFKFENYMFKLKQLLKTSRYPLQQIHNRIVEERNLQKKCEPYKYPLIIRKKENITGVQLQNSTLSLKPNDNCVLLENNQIVLIEKFDIINSHVVCSGRYYLDPGQFFESPCNSKTIGIYTVKQEFLSKNIISFNIESIVKKCFRIPYLEYMVIVALLH